MLVMANGFRCSASSPTWTTSITRTDMVWIWNSFVPNRTSSVPFFQAKENWNNSISNWRSQDLDRIDPVQVKLFVELVLEQVPKLVMIKTQRNNQHNLVPLSDWSIGFVLKSNKGIHIKDMIYAFKSLSLDSTRNFWNM